MKPFRILVVDDEDGIRYFLEKTLKSAGYNTNSASNGFEALNIFKNQDFNMIILDLIMPGMDGLQTLKEFRSISDVPIIILSARGSSQERTKGLELGADDYLPKPFDPDELIARISAVKRRTIITEKRHQFPIFTIGKLTIDFNKQIAMIDSTNVHLTRMEWLLLRELLQNANSLLTHVELLTKIWGPEYRNDLQLLRTWISLPRASNLCG